ncbi:unnamed protein product [Brassica oleracea]|uniref:(rape) hypothetical protein n=1 Tax=Brassica napus TaxID=3708 RepID=A0A816JD61_BRANA|nr:unnamed protein product [Brassica napus]
MYHVICVLLQPGIFLDVYNHRVFYALKLYILYIEIRT